LDSGLSLLAFQTLALRTVVGTLLASMTGRGGTPLARRRNVAFASDLTTLHVRGRPTFPYQLDGDYLGQVESLELCYVPDLLSLVVPTPRRARDT
jgi:hypothetical protein